jgi:hypothetical protein
MPDSYNPAMPITIEIQQGGDRTNLWMLVATIGLFAAACGQAAAAFYQAIVAKRQAKAAEQQTATAQRQAEAADRQVEAARKAIVASIMMADDAAMPLLMFWVSGAPQPGYIQLSVKNIGTGMAQDFALGHWVEEQFVRNEELSKLYLPSRVMASGVMENFRIERKALLADGGVVLRFESSQHTQIDERLSITETNTLSTNRLRVYRPYTAHNFLD